MEHTIANANVRKNISDPDLVKMTTALHVACLKNNIETVKYLLDQHKLDVNYLDRTGSTPLMYAAWKGHLDLVKLLVLKYRADPKIKNFKNGTAERYAKHAGWVEVADFLKSYHF
jgi:ankyrin repeat protein